MQSPPNHGLRALEFRLNSGAGWFCAPDSTPTLHLLAGLRKGQEPVLVQTFGPEAVGIAAVAKTPCN